MAAVVENARWPSWQVAHSAVVGAKLTLGASLAVSGVCLTVVEGEPGRSAVELARWMEDVFGHKEEPWHATGQFAPVGDRAVSVDGAARILDPVFDGITTGHHLWGLFLKDYRPAPW